MIDALMGWHGRFSSDRGPVLTASFTGVQQFTLHDYMSSNEKNEREIPDTSPLQIEAAGCNCPVPHEFYDLASSNEKSKSRKSNTSTGSGHSSTRAVR